VTIRLVIAEDHHVVAQALATMLAFDGEFEVMAITGSGSEVIDLVEEHGPDVVLMDVSLEGLNGIEATRRIRAGHDATQVVMLTMHDDEGTVTDAVAAGALGFLPKNVQREELETAVRAVAAGEGFLHPSVTSRFLRKVAPLAADSLGPERLTDREVEVLECLTEGLTTRQIAERLILGEETVKSHLARIYQKLGVNDRVQAVALAIRRGLVR
jgi:DNA-binding NarL/FixJ family response regulator